MGKRMLSEAEGYGLLKRYGIPVPEHARVKDPDEAVQTTGRIGYPVVMKVVSEQVVHKSDAGGVVLGLRDEEEAKRSRHHDGCGLEPAGQRRYGTFRRRKRG